MIANEGVGIWALNAPTTHLSGNRFASTVGAGIVGLSPAVEVAINGQPIGTLPKVTVGNTTYVSVWPPPTEVFTQEGLRTKPLTRVGFTAFSELSPVIID